MYEEAGLPVQLRYLGNLIGFFQSEIGTLNQVVHLWGFEDLNERQRRRAEMARDPVWLEFLRRNEELGALMHQESKILTPVRFSRSNDAARKQCYAFWLGCRRRAGA